jgi:hypothetical protein
MKRDLKLGLQPAGTRGPLSVSSFVIRHVRYTTVNWFDYSPSCVIQKERNLVTVRVDLGACACQCHLSPQQEKRKEKNTKKDMHAHIDRLL